MNSPKTNVIASLLVTAVLVGNTYANPGTTSPPPTPVNATTTVTQTPDGTVIAVIPPPHFPVPPPPPPPTPPAPTGPPLQEFESIEAWQDFLDWLENQRPPTPDKFKWVKVGALIYIIYSSGEIIYYEIGREGDLNKIIPNPSDPTLPPGYVGNTYSDDLYSLTPYWDNYWNYSPLNPKNWPKPW
jgi:hypothetical protein